MATEAQILANRTNALKSTGPRTEAGKARSRLNALKHGLHSTIVEPVLPQEDPAGLQSRIDRWIDDYRPTSDIERDLVARAATTSWVIDRARRCETALLSRQVRKALLGSRAERIAEACDLGRKLFYLASRRLASDTGPGWPDAPAAFVAALEETPEGVGWLLGRWEEIRSLIRSREPWTYLDQFKFVRLMGKHPFDAIDDPELNEIFLAWEVIEEGWGVEFWKKVQEAAPREDPAFSAWRAWRELVPRPDDASRAFEVLTTIVGREIERLGFLLADLEAVEGDDLLELAAQASFQAGDAAERLRRHQSIRTRELFKTLDTLTKLRKESGRPDARRSSSPPAARSKSLNEPEVPTVAVATKPDPTPAIAGIPSPKRSRSSASLAPRLRVVVDDPAPPPPHTRRGSSPAPRASAPIIPIPAPLVVKPLRAKRAPRTP